MGKGQLANQLRQYAQYLHHLPDFRGKINVKFLENDSKESLRYMNIDPNSAFDDVIICLKEWVGSEKLLKFWTVFSRSHNPSVVLKIDFSVFSFFVSLHYTQEIKSLITGTNVVFLRGVIWYM